MGDRTVSPEKGHRKNEGIRRVVPGSGWEQDGTSGASGPRADGWERHLDPAPVQPRGRKVKPTSNEVSDMVFVTDVPGSAPGRYIAPVMEFSSA